MSVSVSAIAYALKQERDLGRKNTKKSVILKLFLYEHQPQLGFASLSYTHQSGDRHSSSPR